MLQIGQVLDGWFNRGFKGSKCKTLLKLASSRIKLLKNKRGLQLKQLRKELARLLENGQESTAHIRVEHIIREQNIMDAYDLLEHFCELLIVRMPIMEIQRECPLDLKEAVSSLIFAAPRASDLPELPEVQTLFSFKYGREFVASATELRSDCGVNRMIIEKLSARAPTARAKLDLMQEIAEEFNVEWDPTSTELEFSKTPQDLMDGPNQFIGPIQMSPIPFYEGDSCSQESTSRSTSFCKDGENSVQEPKFVPVGGPTPQYETEVLPNRFYSPPRESSITQQSELLEETLFQRSHSRTKSEGSMNLQDYIETAEAAADSAEKAARDARAAAELCRLRISLKAKGRSHGEAVAEVNNSNVPSSADLKVSHIPDDYDWTQEYKGERQKQNGDFLSRTINDNGNENMHNHHPPDEYDWEVESYTKKPQDYVFSSQEHLQGKGQPDEDNFIFYGEADASTYEKPALGSRKEAESIFTPFDYYRGGYVKHGLKPVYPAKGQHDEDTHIFYGEPDVPAYEKPALGSRKEAESIFTPSNDYPRGHVEHDRSHIYPGKGQPTKDNFGEADTSTYDKPALGSRKEAESIFTPFHDYLGGHAEPSRSHIYDTPRFDGSETVTVSEPFRRQVSLEDDPYYTYPNLFSTSSSR